MDIATWNINGVKARLETAVAWLKEASPDVACLQEIKSEDAPFPRETFEALGYHVETHGQKGFNGVAILSKTPLSDVTRGLPGDDRDEQARFITARVAPPDDSALPPVRVACLYLPNGNPLGTEKFPYKLAWMERLIAFAETCLLAEEPLVLAGDYNVIPDARDLYSEKAWIDDALYQPESRGALRRLEALGYTDALRAVSDETAFHLLGLSGRRLAEEPRHPHRSSHVSPQLADRLEGIRVDDHVRGWEKPSDHVPVVGRFGQ
jgi:exodeoxyribonuclease-3